MPEAAAIILWCAIGAYSGFGALIALYTLVFGLRRFDSAAADAPIRVKLLLIPGMIALWPIALSRLFGRQPSEDAQ